LVIADDMFSRFQSEGLRNRATAFDYRDEVLAKGGSRPAAESVAAFLGRSFNFDSFQRRLGEGP
jgi:thimet oligopeptidase